MLKNLYYFHFIIIFSVAPYLLHAQKDSTDYYTKILEGTRTENNFVSTKNLKNIQKCISFFTEKKDSIKLAESLIQFSHYYSRTGEYNTSFEIIWKAITIANIKKDIYSQYNSYNQLARLYLILGKKKEAYIQNKKVIEISKKGIKQGIIQEKEIIPVYFDLVDFYSKNQQLYLAKKYLDSCFYFAKKSNFTYDQKAYLLSEKGNLILKSGKTKEAISILEESEKNFIRLNPTYLTIIYYRLGNAYKANNQLLIAKDYYQKALKILETDEKKHYDYKPKILFDLSQTLNKLDQHEKAYEVLIESKKISEQLFSSQSKQNEDLLAIPNLYEEELLKKDKAIKERDIELLEKKAILTNFKISSITVVSLIAIGVLFFYVHRQRKKLQSQKEKQLEQKQRNNTLIGLKNKELTAFTLQLIDKENLINELVKDIKTHAPNNDRLIKTTQQKQLENNNLWERFDQQFTKVNKDFYPNLKQKFPNLTPTELKHCALIKLNFSAKEMAKLLNISLNGVNTSRYRIRKKLNLQREDSLVKFITSI